MSTEQSVRELVFDTFRGYKIGANEILPDNVIDAVLRPKLTPPQRRALNGVIEGMVAEGLITVTDEGVGGWFLTEAGEELVY